MSLPTGRRDGPAARSRSAPAARSSSAGKSTPASSSSRDLGDRRAVRGRGPPRATASSSRRSSTSRQPSTPRWCGELQRARARARARAPSARDEREVGLRVAAVDGEHDRRGHATRLPAVRALGVEQPLDELLVERVLADQRVGEQRLPRERRVAGTAACAASRSYAATCWTSPSSSGASGACGSGTRPVRLDPRRHLDDVVVGEPGERARVPDVDLVHVAVAGDERGDEAGRGLAVERAAALLEQRGLLGQRRVAVELEQLALDLGDDLARAARRRAARRAPRRGGRSSAGRTRGRRRAPRAAAAAAPPARAISSPCAAISSGSTSRPSTSDGADPGEVVEPDLVDDDLARARRRAGARTSAGSRSRRCRGRPRGGRRRAATRVTIPTGFVKSTIQASGAASSRTRSAISSTTGTVRSALAKPPAPVVSWPMQPQASGTVSSESRAAWPPTRIWTSTKSAPSRARSSSPVTSSAPSKPCRSSIRAARPPTTSRRSGSMSCSTSSRTPISLPLAREPGDELRRVRRPAADRPRSSSLHPGQRDALDERLLGEEEERRSPAASRGASPPWRGSTAPGAASGTARARSRRPSCPGSRRRRGAAGRSRSSV